MQSKATLRKFIRHPVDVPIKVALDWVADDHTLHLRFHGKADRRHRHLVASLSNTVRGSAEHDIHYCRVNQHYRDQVEQQEGRQLSREQAASEWIARYAKDFPALKHDHK